MKGEDRKTSSRAQVHNGMHILFQTIFSFIYNIYIYIFTQEQGTSFQLGGGDYPMREATCTEQIPDRPTNQPTHRERYWREAGGRTESLKDWEKKRG